METAWLKDYDDSLWDAVTIPHDWSTNLPFSREYSSGTGYAAGGIGWYRCRFFLPDEYRGKKISLLFDDIYKDCQIWCNSSYQGFHPNGYTPISYDITEHATFGKDVNVISVHVDHTELADSRWYTGSGIYRKVSVIVTEPLHLAENGMFFCTKKLTERCALLNFEYELVNDGEACECVTLTTILSDPAGSEAASFSAELQLPPKSKLSAVTQGELLNPNLWSPDTPNLYTVQTNLTTATGFSSIADTQVIGIRQCSFDADFGFSLNGTAMKLKGVCLHHDAGTFGSAVTKEIWLRRLLKLKLMGCNAIRTSHNPHMPELYELCDSLGFLVIDEAFDEWEVPKNKWSTGHNVYPPKHQGYYKYFPEWHLKDLTAMIRRDRNHPCVILWSIGNEIDYPNDPSCHPLFESMTGNNDANKPAAERQFNPNRPNAERLAVLASMLAEEVRSIDITHPVTLAAAFPELSARLGFLDALDVAGYNYKEQLYEESHNTFKALPFLGSENGHSYQAWLSVTNNTYISGQFLWTGIDYLGEAHGWPVRGSGAGLLTLAGYEKSGYYRRMSFWSQTPMVHLVTARADAPGGEWKRVLETWNYSEGDSVEVHCYTNLEEAELILNQNSLGRKTRDWNTDCISWKVPFMPGTLLLHAFQGNTVIEDSLETVYAACKLSISDFKPPEQYKLPDETIIQIEVSVLDCYNHLVRTDSSMLHVFAEGATLIGIENGDISDTTEYTSSSRRAFHGQMIVYLQRSSASLPVKIQICGESLTPTNITIE